jgi:hypothetical protein
MGRRVLLLLRALLGTLLGSLLGSFLLGHSTSSLKQRLGGQPLDAAPCSELASHHLPQNRLLAIRGTSTSRPCALGRHSICLPSQSHASGFQLLLSNFSSSYHSCRSNAVNTSSLYLPCASEIVKGKSSNHAQLCAQFFEERFRAIRTSRARAARGFRNDFTVAAVQATALRLVPIPPRDDPTYVPRAALASARIAARQTRRDRPAAHRARRTALE